MEINHPEPVVITAADGYRLAGLLYRPEHSLRGNIIVAGATGVPQRFYRRFAEYCGWRGYTTLTLDYRGVGESRRASLKGFKMHLLDWGRQDLSAAVEMMSKESGPLFLVGHSFGGHALGLLPNHHKIAACYIYGMGAGWHGWMPFIESLRVRLLWNVILPALVFWKGYAPMSWLGMGEDIPSGVYKPWREWCRHPHYFFDDRAWSCIEDQYGRVRTPIVAANALDDAWATPASRDAFVRGYCRAPRDVLDLAPEEIGHPIGHMGYFRATASPLWADTLRFFGSGEAPASASRVGELTLTTCPTL